MKPEAIIRSRKGFLIAIALFILIAGLSFSIVPTKAQNDPNIVYVVICIDSEMWWGDLIPIGNTNPHPTMDMRSYSRTSPLNVAAVFDSNFRDSHQDSFGNIFRMTWFAEMDYLMAQSNFVWRDGSPAGVSGYTAIHDILMNNWGTEIQTYGDSIEYHHHFMTYDGIWGWQRYDNGPDSSYPEYQMYALDHMIIDRNFYPSTWRSGWLIMPSALSNWLEQWMPFDYTPSSGIWYPMHPSGMNRWQTRSSGPSQSDVNEAFARARAYGSAIYSLWFHDRDNMANLINSLQSYLNTADSDPAYPNVSFKYASAREAMQQALGFSDFTPPTFTVTPNGGTYTITSNELLWQNHPYVALKYTDGTYVHPAATTAGTNTWTVMPPTQLVSEENIAVRARATRGLSVANATASSYMVSQEPPKAIDGDDDVEHYSYWSSASALPQWLKLDLGSVQSFGNIRIHFLERDNRYHKYYIDVSNDSSSWTPVVEEKVGQGVTWNYLSPAISARYIRITVTYNSVTPYAQIVEVNVGVDPASITASSYDDGHTPDLAIDGIESTSNYWGTNPQIPEGQVPQWLKIDLRSPVPISKITIHFYDGDTRTYNYYVETSNDNSSWTTIVPSKNGSGIVTDTFPEVTARYVRITITWNTANLGAHIKEIQIYNITTRILPSFEKIGVAASDLYGNTGVLVEEAGRHLTLTTSPLGVTTPIGQGWYDAGVYASISTDQYVNTVSGTRYRFNGWTTADMTEITDPASPSTTVLMDVNKIVTANYVLQYLFTFNQTGLDTSAMGTVVTVDGSAKTYGDLPFSKWVDKDTPVTYNYEPIVSSSDVEKRFRLNNTTIIMTGSVTITGNYVTQYYLTVNTDPAEVLVLNPLAVSGQGWYDSGATATVNAVQFVDKVVGQSRYDFRSWTGATQTGTGNQATVVIDEAKTVTANYVLQYLVTFGHTSLDASAIGTVVTVDSSTKTYADLPFNMWVDNGTSVSYIYENTVLSNDSGKKFRLDSVTGPLSQITVTSATTVTGNYMTQFYLTVISLYDTPSGEGWYNASSIAYATLATDTVSGGTGTQYIFTGWSGNATGTDLTSNAITMDGPKTAVANWKTQYYLTVNNGSHGTAAGEGWYDTGVSAAFSISPTIVYEEVGTRYVFTQWSGDSTSTNASDTILINGPKTVTANWKTQYLVTFEQTGSGAIVNVTYTADTDPMMEVPFSIWVKAGSTLTFSYDTIVNDGYPTRYVFVSVNQTSPLIVNEPITIIAIYKTQHYLTVGHSPIDAILDGHQTGQGYYDADSPATVTADLYVDIVSGESRYMFDHWSEDASGTNTTTTVVMNAPKTATANYKAQYYISVTSVHDNPTPSDWVDAGSDFTASVTSPTEIVPDDHQWVCIGFSVDGGAYEAGTTYTFIDVQAPHTINFAWEMQYLEVIPPMTVHDYDGLWHTADFTITLTATDNISGVAETYYKINDGSIQNVSSHGQPLITTEGADNKLEYWSVDNAGNEESHNILTGIKLDKTPPIISGVPTTSPNAYGWYNTDVIIHFNGSDVVSGIDYLTPDETVTTEGENQSVTGMARDIAGNLAYYTVIDINIDKTPPNISGAATTSPNVNGWYNTDVTVHFEATDSLSGVDSVTVDQIITTEGVNQSVNGVAIDKAGNSASYTVTDINIDKTPPIITGAPTTPANAYGWYRTNVTIHFDASDALSGLDTVTSNQTLSAESANQSVIGYATDLAGNSASYTVSEINIDKTPPTISGTPTTLPNVNGWYNTDVTVHFEASDALSDIDFITPDQTLSTEGADQSVVGTATDRAGNEVSYTVLGINIDKTPPLITGVATISPNIYGWYNTDVVVHFDASDTLSGIDTVTPDQTLTSEGADQSVLGTAVDLAGNEASYTVTGINIDKTHPIITGAATSSPNIYGWYKTDVIVNFTASDALSGLAEVTPDQSLVTEGADLSVLGTAVDKAGNIASYTVTGINIDKTPPTITGSPTTLPNANNWYNTSVVVHFDASDLLSGIDTITPDTILSSDGAGQSVTGTASDKAGNSASFTVSEINIDQTPPIISGVPTTSPNAYGWYKTDVTVNFTASDSLSSIDTVTPDQTLTTEGVGQTVTGTVVDKAGNSASYTVSGINIDKTVPTTYLTIGDPKFDTNPTYVSPTTPFTLNASDDLSGIYYIEYRFNSDPWINYTESFTLSEIGNYTLYYHSFDKAENTEPIRQVSIVVSDSFNIVLVEPSKTVVAQGYNLTVTVKVVNYGIEDETFNVTVYVNTTLIQTQTVTLESGNSIAIIFNWDTTGEAYGNYTISAHVTTDTVDNTYSGGTVTVTILGDVNGDIKVDASDLSYLRKTYGSTPFTPNWNANCDVNGDNRVDILDLFDLGKNYGNATGDVDGDGIMDAAIIPYDFHSLSTSTVNTLQMIKSSGVTLWFELVFIEAETVGLAYINADVSLNRLQIPNIMRRKLTKCFAKYWKTRGNRRNKRQPFTASFLL